MIMFKDYGSFLEVAFAVNVLFAAWDGAYSRLRDRLTKISPKGWAARSLGTTARVFQVFGGLIAAAIAVALFAVDPNRHVGVMEKSLIAATGVVPVYLVIFMLSIPATRSYSLLSKRHDKGSGNQNESPPK